MIDFKEVSKVYDNGSVALDKINIHIDKGEFVFLVGASGAGKSAAENVSFAMEVIETPRRIMKERVRTVLDLVGLSGKADELPQNLSGGEQQRVAIARAIVNRPLLLIADEPTGNLDPDTSKGIMDIFTKINHMGTTVLMVTHDKQMVDLMNKRVIEIDNGRIVRDELKGGYGNEN